MSAPDRRAMLDRGHPRLSIRRQCAVLHIARSGIYRPKAPANDNDLALMRRMDELYLQYPFLGSRRMAAMLSENGARVNRKRVQRLMRQMGIAALGPRPKTSKPAPGHKVYPYLLRGLKIERPNQVWAADITYIPMGRGFLYLVAVMDWASRRFFPGGCRTRWTPPSASRRSRKRWRASASLRFSTPIKAANSPAPPSLVSSIGKESGSRWMAAAARWITSSSSAYGAR
jgi:transposase InsO family protein